MDNCMRNDKVLVPSFKKDDSMFHGLDGDRASPEPFQVLPRWLLQVHLDSNGTMDVDLISEEPRVWGPACWRRNIAHVSWVLVGAASRDASKQLPKNPQERLSAVCLQGTESMKPPTPARLPFGSSLLVSPSSLTFMRCGAADNECRSKGTEAKHAFWKDSCPPSLMWGRLGEEVQPWMKTEVWIGPRADAYWN